MDSWNTEGGLWTKEKLKRMAIQKKMGPGHFSEIKEQKGKAGVWKPCVGS